MVCSKRARDPASASPASVHTQKDQTNPTQAQSNQAISYQTKPTNPLPPPPPPGKGLASSTSERVLAFFLKRVIDAIRDDGLRTLTTVSPALQSVCAFSVSVCARPCVGMCVCVVSVVCWVGVSVVYACMRQCAIAHWRLLCVSCAVCCVGTSVMCAYVRVGVRAPAFLRSTPVSPLRDSEERFER